MKIEKNEIFLREDKYDSEAEKESPNRPKEEYIWDAEASNLGIFLFLLLSCDSTRFTSLRWLELGNSPIALAAETLPVVALICRFRIKSSCSRFVFINSLLVCFPYSDCLTFDLTEIMDLMEN